MPTVGWDETTPADGDSIGQGDDQIRSLKSSIRVGLNDEHNWPSGGGADTGYHRYGSARPYVGTQSAVSSSGSDGRLMHTSDTSRLFGVGSGGTVFIGGPTVVSVGTFPGSIPQRHHWVEEVGFITGADENELVTIPNSGYSGAPYIMVSAFSAGGGNVVTNLLTVSKTDFRIHSLVGSSGANASGHTLFWRSLGSRVL